MNNYKLLGDGEIKLSGRRQVVIYDYKPLTVSSPPEKRGALSLEVLDEAQYSQKEIVLIDIAGFPYPDQPEPETHITEVSLDEDTQTFTVFWRQASHIYDLTLYFDDNCQKQKAQPLPNDNQKITLSYKGWSAGNCVVYLVNQVKEQYNQVDFFIPENSLENPVEPEAET